MATLAPFCAVLLPMWTMLSPWSKQSHGCSCQGCKATNTPEVSGTWTLPPEPAPTRAGTLRNPPEPSEPCLRNLHQHGPEPSGTFQDLPEPTFRNLPEPTTSRTYTSIHRNPPKSSGTFRELASGTYTILHRNSPEPSATCLRNLHQHTPEPSGTHTGTLRNLPETSGTFLRNPLLRPAPPHKGAYLGWRPH